jgi:hypothetical protein
MTKTPDDWMTKPCETWPYCTCGESWVRWETRLREWNDGASPPPADGVECAEFDIFLMLHCVSVHCPDWQTRRHAVLQLMRPTFDRHRAQSRQ